MQKLMRIKGKKFEWSEEAQAAFEKIKRELCEAPVLDMPTEKGKYDLDTDTSVVSQELCIRSRSGMAEQISVPLHMGVKY